jgi:Flp pilus assembly pilin Flp
MNLMTFIRDEDGAVSIDWVVLTAAIVAMGVAVGSSVRSNTSTLTASIGTSAGAVTTTNSFSSN